MRKNKNNRVEAFELQNFLSNNERQMLANGIISKKISIGSVN